MASMGGWLLLFFLAVATSSAHGAGNLTLRCYPGHATALLVLKKSFFFDEATTNLPSWQDGTDCCRWEGVGCHGSSGGVTALDLSGRGLYSLGLDPVIFNLSSLRFLDLSMADFGYSMLSVGFERLTYLAHLNLSNSGFGGQIPVGIGKLENLISLDLSNRYGGVDVDDGESSRFAYNSLSLSNLQALLGNIRNLRELYPEAVKYSGAGEDWCDALAKSVPRLEVLILEDCGLKGIHQSLSSITSLTVINLGHNLGISGGVFPEFLMDFVNLTVLRLANIDLEGRFPTRIFRSKDPRVLDLSFNLDLSGNLPNFSNASSLGCVCLGWSWKEAAGAGRSHFILLELLAGAV